jgi:hypothetical protein
VDLLFSIGSVGMASSVFEAPANFLGFSVTASFASTLFDLRVVDFDSSAACGSIIFLGRPLFLAVASSTGGASSAEADRFFENFSVALSFFKRAFSRLAASFSAALAALASAFSLVAASLAAAF